MILTGSVLAQLRSYARKNMCADGHHRNYSKRIDNGWKYLYICGYKNNTYYENSIVHTCVC